MRSFVYLSAAAVWILAAATPAAARDGAWYVGGDFGAMIVEDTDIGINGADDAVTIFHDDIGFDGAAFIGYDLGAFRLEAEVAYKAGDMAEFENRIAIPSSSGPHPIGRREGFGAESALSFMINGMLDFGDDDGISGFVGAGSGVARVDFANLRAFENTGEFLHDSDTAFAWQLVAGLRTAISKNVDATVRYRYFNAGGLDMRGFGNDEVSARFRSHSVLAGLTFNFGGPPD
jgi:OOP family OmpA-OmpF porin